MRAMRRVRTQNARQKIIGLESHEYVQRVRNTDKILWHSVKREGYPPISVSSNSDFQCESSEFLLLTIQEHDYFTGHLNAHICLGLYCRDWYGDPQHLKHPNAGWIDDTGDYINNARVTHWAVAPQPRKGR